MIMEQKIMGWRMDMLAFLPRNLMIIFCFSCADQNNKTIAAFVCDGILECADLSDECNSNCTRIPAFCAVAPSYASRGNLTLTCASNSSGNITFNEWDICDGKWTACSPRVAHEEIGCLERFYCTSGSPLSIPSWKVRVSRRMVCNWV